ncbi:NAD-dependent DNA ligase LigA [Candidatus Uhrbacteria bacterium]|nr:NAD-dependent DNA ligase LigA [Candidatus Uhrbacteria bacterium]
MTKREAAQRIEKLRHTIEHHRYLYHVRDTQEISDVALDSLKHELYRLEQEYPDLIIFSSPTQRVGGKALEKFQKVRHEAPMRSMEDVFSFEEFTDWEARLKRIIPSLTPQYYTELKMDGLAVSLEYRNRVFAIGSTRGDGMQGEDVTQNLKTIEAIPLELRVPSQKEIKDFLHRFASEVDEKKFLKRLHALDGIIEVRGEVFMTKKMFTLLNKNQKKKGEALFANPRNASAGSIRQLDPAITASRNLDFFGYALMNEESFGITTHQQAHEVLSLIGIKSNPHNELCASNKEVEIYHTRMSHKRDSLPYWTDGVVVVINSNMIFQKLGVVGKAPRGMIAYKFPAEQATTIIESVTFQVGRTGALTPIAHFKPVSIAGTTVTNATLHNMDEIDRLRVRIGDTVIIEKAGDIIPKVVETLPEMRTGKEIKIHAPARCPVCSSSVARAPGEVALYCSNPACFGKEKEAIIHFVSKKAFNIEGLGDKIVEQLMHAGLVGTPADIFSLKRGDVEPLERFAAKKAQNLIDAIQKRKKTDLHRFLYALGIRHVGQETASDLSGRFGTIEKIMDVSQEEIEAVPNIGSVVAKSIVDYFTDPKNRELVTQLLKNGVAINPVAANRFAQTLTGKIFVLTGELESMTRDIAKEKIRERGGDISSSVSARTDYVVVGIHPGSKYDRAKKLGVRTIQETEFLKML